MIYYDEEGNERPLNWLVRNDPDWAANRMQADRAQIRLQKAEIERLKNLWFNDADPRETEYAKEYKDLLIARSNGDPRILDLYGGDPNCKHELDHHEMNGVRCLKCGAWFCY